MSDCYPVSQLDCDHGPIQDLSQSDRMGLLLMGETVECEDCGVTFKPNQDAFQRDVYLVREDVERL